MEDGHERYLAGVHGAQGIVRHMMGQVAVDSYQPKKMNKKVQNLDLGRVEIGKIGNTAVYVRHAIKSGDYLGASELGRATFPYDAEGNEWTNDDDSSDSD